VREDDRVKQTSAYLRMLLLRPGEYRSAWERHADTILPGKINIEAVARVLGEHGDGPVPADVARRALEGRHLDQEIVDRLIGAFDISPRHATRLRDLMRGSPALRVITGHAEAPPELVAGGPPQAETLALHELHTLGPDGAPAEHQTIQVIKSTVDGLASLPYRFDTDELAVEVIRGGRVDDHIYRLNETLYAVNLLLEEPLAAGQTALMQVRTVFHYKEPPAPEFRRGVMSSTKDLTIWVRFHPDRVPRKVWLASWDRVDHARILEQEPAELDDEHSVHCRFAAIDKYIVGFHWEW
jgi:hypothetical protein